jgi:hypothetical protein
MLQHGYMLRWQAAACMGSGGLKFISTFFLLKGLQAIT